MRDHTEGAAAFVGKAVAKAIQSEEIAAAHYRRLAEIVPETDATLAVRFVEDADEEERHAEALRRAAKRDGVAIPETAGWDDDTEGVRTSFESCARRGDIAACLFIQDVFLEVVAIEFYELLAQAASSVGAVALEALVDKAIVPDERLHLANGLREIARRLPERSQRVAAFRRAAEEVLPAMHVFADTTAEAPCPRTCGACGDRCLKLDACAGTVSLAGFWGRITSGIEDAVHRVGIGEVFDS